MKKKINTIFSFVSGMILGSFLFFCIVKPIILKKRRLQELSDKHLRMFLLMNDWVRIKQNKKNLTSYFEKRGYEEIAIYGMSYIGETLIRELSNTKVRVVYAIDKQKEGDSSNIDIIAPDNVLPKVDCIVVTAIFYYEEILATLSNKIKCPIVSLEDVLLEL